MVKNVYQKNECLRAFKGVSKTSVHLLQISEPSTTPNRRQRLHNDISSEVRCTWNSSSSEEMGFKTTEPT